ncbi:amino acid permease [Pseudalkalibacillus berkeleyi]|uniref:Amino acid permease n=1 Tax=Pseudalkalibacillus berkeleyi TaxID=1069813 RepID=A0ABS9GXM5_9BACL|nr:amino acid permease [Pseudalkalibacillus berkeleyi]MCF6136440.1 amino acid permease [Pseudalkalibacillus berkeleyi]
MKKCVDAPALSWWQLSLIGVGCIIGTGFFLGSSIAIQKSGPSVLIAFFLAAVGTYIVFNAMARMTVEYPERGSFRTFAKKAYGKSAGFGAGWIFWTSEMLIMGSQLTALAIFTQVWFPSLPLWLLATVYAVIGLTIILLGVDDFERVENIFGLIKVAAIIMFIIIGSLALFGVLEVKKESVMEQQGLGTYFEKGTIGLWTALIYAFYTFGGIEVMGLMATELKDKGDAPKSGKLMLIALAVMYKVSIGFVLLLVSWKEISIDESPFLTALNDYNLPYIPHVFNGMLIVAGFSTMVAALYGVTTMIVTLSKDGDAPKAFSKKGRLDVPVPALVLTAGGLIASIVISLIFPEKMYEYITTAAGLMLLYTWLLILLSFVKLMKKNMWDWMKISLGGVLILLAVSGTLFDETSRPGLYVSLLFLIIIGSTAWLRNLKKSDVV